MPEEPRSSMPRVTVLMSVYNGAAFLATAIRSILDQSFQDFEFLIFDDGSKDETPRILESFQDPRIRVVRTENRGIGRALERGVVEAQGAYLARMDADDIALPDRLRRQVEFLDRNPDIGVVTGDHQQMNVEGDPLPTPPDPTLQSPAVIAWKLIWQNVILHPLVMIRLDVLRRTGLNYDPTSVCEDYDLWTRLMFRTRFAHLPGVLLHYRRNPRGITGSFGVSQFGSMSQVCQRTFEDLLGTGVDPRVGRTMALLSKQSAILPASMDLIRDDETLVTLARETRRRFAERLPLSASDAAIVDDDLASRLVEWGFSLSRIPGREQAVTGALLRQAVRMNPRILLDPRVLRNFVVRLIGARTYLKLRTGDAA